MVLIMVPLLCRWRITLTLYSNMINAKHGTFEEVFSFSLKPVLIIFLATLGPTHLTSILLPNKVHMATC